MDKNSGIVALTMDEIDSVSGGLSSNGWTTYGNMLIGAAGVAGVMGAEPVAAGLGIIGIGALGIGYMMSA